MSALVLRSFEQGEDGYAEKSHKFLPKLDLERDLSRDKLFAANINEEIAPVMESYDSFTTALANLSKEMNEMNQTRAKKLRV